MSKLGRENTPTKLLMKMWSYQLNGLYLWHGLFEGLE